MIFSLCFAPSGWKCWNGLMVVIKIVEIFTNNQLYRGRGLEYNHERRCFVSPGVLLLLSSVLCNPWLYQSMARARAQPSSDADTWRIFSAPGWIFNSPLFLSRTPGKGAEAEKWYLAQQTGIKHYVLRPGLCKLLQGLLIKLCMNINVNSEFAHEAEQHLLYP